MTDLKSQIISALTIKSPRTASDLCATIKKEHKINIVKGQINQLLFGDPSTFTADKTGDTKAPMWQLCKKKSALSCRLLEVPDNQLVADPAKFFSALRHALADEKITDYVFSDSELGKTAAVIFSEPRAAPRIKPHTSPHAEPDDAENDRNCGDQNDDDQHSDDQNDDNEVENDQNNAESDQSDDLDIHASAVVVVPFEP